MTSPQPTTSDMTVEDALELIEGIGRYKWSNGNGSGSKWSDSEGFDITESVQQALAAIEAHYAAKHKEANDLANKYARIIAAVYDGERVEDAEPRIMAERLNNTEEV